tara:strand:+ start:688 stop:1110 length:423 start_codon:yes stop_codon:yes gene_type:complete
MKKIFLVDDDKFYINILEKKLKDIKEYSIEKFYTGQACIDKLHEKPDIIFLDHILGDTTGLEVLKIIRSTYPEVHVVLLSGQKEIKVAIKSFKFGATDYLFKGIDDNPTQLAKIIKDCENNKITSNGGGENNNRNIWLYF